MHRRNCPDSETLQNLLLGKLPAVERETLGGHLLECKLCAATAETLSASDPLTEAIRTRRIYQGQEDVLAQVIERGKQIPPLEETLVETSTNGLKTISASGAPDQRVSPLDLSFLAPPEDKGELGRLGGYRVLEILGAGGMGVVFRAEDQKLHRPVALKVMKPAIASDPLAKERFLREAQAAAAIEHDHIVAIYQVGDDRGVPFIAMPYLRGESLKMRLAREGRLDPREVTRIGREIASGLAAAHEHGLIHRDIKPDNIWLQAERGRVKILDFGLVRAVDGAVDLTQSGVVMGTPKYMAPEQAEGKPVDHRSDLFSLGSVLYHLATGTAPFTAPNLTATLLAVTQQEPQPLDALRADLPSELVRLIMDLLAKPREARPQSAQDVAERLRAIEEITDSEATYRFPSPETARQGHSISGVKMGTAMAFAGMLLLLGVILILRGKDGKVKQQIPLETGDRLEIVDSPESAETKSTLEPLAKKAGVDAIWVSRVAALAAQDQAKEVIQELKRRNPGFAGHLAYQVQEEQVADWTIAGGTLLDLSPLLALKSLKTLNYADLDPQRDAWVLREISSLEKINDWSAAGYRLCYPANKPQPGVDEAWVESVQKLPAESQIVLVMQKLKEQNPNFDMRYEHGISKGKVTLIALSFEAITDLSPLKALPHLMVIYQRLKPDVQSWLSDLSPLEGMPLFGVNLTATRAADLSALKGMRLTELGLSSLTTDLSPLEGMPLKDLRCNNAQIADLSPLKGMPLSVLDCSYSKVTDLTPLEGMPLTHLRIWHVRGLKDLSPLKGMRLEQLDCSMTNVSDLSPLKGMPLKNLSCYWTGVKDFSPIRDMPLVELRFSPVTPANLAIVKEIKTLKIINQKPAEEFWKDHPAPSKADSK